MSEARRAVMQLKYSVRGALAMSWGNTMVFCLDVRADYSPEGRTSIRKSNLSSQTMYNSRRQHPHKEDIGLYGSLRPIR
jgi:hypothetical protein